MEGRTAAIFLWGRYPSATSSGYPINRKLFLLFPWSTKSYRLTEPMQRLGVWHTCTPRKHTAWPRCTSYLIWIIILHISGKKNKMSKNWKSTWVGHFKRHENVEQCARCFENFWMDKRCHNIHDDTRKSILSRFFFTVLNVSG